MDPKHKSISPTFMKLLYLVLFAVAFFLFALLYFFITIDIVTFISTLRKLIITGVFAMSLIIGAGILRKKSILSLRLLKLTNFVFYSFLIPVYILLFTALFTCNFVGKPANVSVETTFFSNKNVMIVVPHQDDDINLAGGLLEQYVKAGSRVSVCFPRMAISQTKPASDSKKH